MAKKKTSGSGFKLRTGLQDERVPKIIGVAMLFFAVYLFIAFSSYLFTWQADQDKVLRLSWSLLFSSEHEMANWLGRLGAMVSNFFFFWMFGLSSFILIYLLVIFGFAHMLAKPITRYSGYLRNATFFMVLIAVFLEFVTGDSSFPWGGAIGDTICTWLTRFLGNIGLFFLLFFTLVGVIVWQLNPNFRELTPGGFAQDLLAYLKSLVSSKKAPAFNTPASAKSAPALKTSNTSSASAKAAASDEQSTEDNDTTTPLRPRGLRPESEPPVPGAGNQLAFELEEEKKKAKAKGGALQPGGGELEINESAAEDTSRFNEPEPIMSEAKFFHDNIEEVQDFDPNNQEPYDPKAELSSYEHPVLPLLMDYSDSHVEIDRAELEQNKDQIIETLLNYKIEIIKIRATIGPTVTLYEIVPAPGVRISKIKNLEDDIALSLSALGIRIIAPIPGRGTIGIEVPNKNKQIVSLKEVLMSSKFREAKMDLPIALGKTIQDEVFVADLAKMPHLLIAGATGQGKSVGINTVLMSLLYKKHPSQVKLVLVDPKKVELFPYSKLEKHFLAFLPDQEEPITTETNKVIHTLNSLCIEMDARYDLLKQAKARNIKEYNEKFIKRRLNPNKGHDYMPFIVLVIDEFADLIMTAGKEVELPIGRLAQLARAVGIHLIIATQRPSVNIITGVIKANFPARIAFKVSSKVDSRTILDAGGADQLIGRGDMLLSVGGDTIRLQCAFVDTPEVENVINYIGDQRGYPEPHYLPEYHGDDSENIKPGDFDINDLDDLLSDAARLVVQNQHGSTSMIQRRLKLGYNRAGRIMDQLEGLGIVGPAEGSKPREVLYYDEVELERYLDSKLNRK